MSATVAEGRPTTAPKLYMLNAIWKIIGDDDQMRAQAMMLVEQAWSTSVGYVEDGLGSLQHVMSLLRATAQNAAQDADTRSKEGVKSLR